MVAGRDQAGEIRALLRRVSHRERLSDNRAAMHAGFMAAGVHRLDRLRVVHHEAASV
jgi:hypothetical protein